MAETQVTQRLNPPAFTVPALFRPDGSSNGEQNGFVTMLQALDSTLTAAAQPQPVAPDANGHHPATRQRAENSKADDDRPEPERPAGQATADHTPSRHDAAAAPKPAKGTAHDGQQNADKPQTSAPPPERLESAAAESAAIPEPLPVATALPEETNQPRPADKPATAVVNVLAGLATPAPKTVATQKASPERTSDAAGMDGAAVPQPSAASEAKTAAVSPTLETLPGTEQPVADTAQPKLPPKLAVPAKTADNTGSGDQPPTNDNIPLRSISLSTPEPTVTEQRHATESDATALAARNPAPATPVTPTPGMMAGSAAPAAKPVEAAPQLQARLEANSVHGIEGNVRLQNAYSNTTQLTAARSAQTATLRAPEIVEQVAVKLNHQAKAGLDTLTIQLRPADLGRIDVKLSFHDGSVTGTIIADNQTTLDLLTKDQRTLERALQDSGLRTDSGSLSFQLRDQSGQQSAQQERGGKRAGWQDVNFDLAAETAAMADAAGDSIITADRVNLRV